MDINDAIYHRRSIRKYQSGFKIPETDLKQILEAAMYAPSAMNKQPWEFFIATDTDLLSKIQTTHPHAPFLCDAGTAIVVCNNLEREHSGMGIIDVSLAAQNILLTAYSLGYGACYCSVYPKGTKIFQNLLKLPEHIEPIGMIVIGQSAEPLPTTTPIRNRFNPSFIHINHW